MLSSIWQHSSPLLHLANSYLSFMSQLKSASSRKSSLTTIKLGFIAHHWPLTAQPCSAVLLMSHYLSLEDKLLGGRVCLVAIPGPESMLKTL